MKLTTLDSAFLVFETEASPQHIAGLMILEPPKGKKKKFGRALYEQMISSKTVQPPFNHLLNVGLGRMPKWKTTEDVDLKHHVRLSHLPPPGTRTDLMQMLGRLHGYRLDRSRPMWEVWIIDGLADGNVAMYTKLHHSMADGGTATTMFGTSCSTNPNEVKPPFWENDDLMPAGAAVKRELNPFRIAQQAGKALLKQADTNWNINLLFNKMLYQQVLGKSEKLQMPFSATQTPFSDQGMDKTRTLVAFSEPLDRFKRLAKIHNSSLNDVVMSVCDMALQHYLKERDKWDAPLVALIPVNLKQAGDESLGNAVSASAIEMGKKSDSPIERLNIITARTQLMKKEIREGSMDAFSQLNFVISTLATAASALPSLNKYLNAQNHLCISNVPGVRVPLYFMGAKVLENYPISIVMPGSEVNITVLSYNGALNFGLVCSSLSLPGFDKMDTYIQQALEELEQDTVKIHPDFLVEAEEKSEPTDKKPTPKARKKAPKSTE